MSEDQLPLGIVLGSALKCLGYRLRASRLPGTPPFRLVVIHCDLAEGIIVFGAGRGLGVA